MHVENIVIHEFIKNKKDDSTESVTEYALRKKENPINNVSTELIDTIHKNYSSKENTVQQGRFKELDTGGNGNFSKYFIAANSLGSTSEVLKILSDKCKKLYPEGYSDSESDFYNLSICFMEGLKEFGKNSNIVGGLLLFAKYKKDGQEFFIVVMLDKTSAYDINDLDLDIEKTEMILIERLRQALRINISRLQKEAVAGEEDKEKRLSYLSFINSGKAEVREFFINAAGCDKQLSNTKASAEIYIFVKGVVDEFKNLKPHWWDIKDSITEYMTERLDKHEGKINRTSLIEHVAQSLAALCPDEDVIEDGKVILVSKASLLDTMLELANDDGSVIPVNFKAVQSVVEKNKRYVKKFKGTYLKIDFSDVSSNPDDLLYWDEDKGVIVINDDEIKNRMKNKDEDEDKDKTE